MPKTSQESFKVYKAILSYLDIKFANDVYILTYSLEFLYRSKFLTEENFNALFRLNEAHLLTQENFNTVTLDCKRATLLINLKAVNFLTEENFNVVKKHGEPACLDKVLQYLIRADLLMHKYFDAVKEHEAPHELILVLDTLNKVNLLTQENFNVVKEHRAPHELARALIAFRRAELLTLENIERLIQPQNNILLTLRIGRGDIIWDRIPLHLLTQDTVEQLITRASLETPAIEIEQYINNLLLDNGAGLNDTQSTHIASIHNAVSASAIKLWARYGAELSRDKIEEIITAIKKDISNIPGTVKNKSAKNCIERITKVNYIFTDSVSQITLRQLLALSYLVIHDNENRWGSREDAYKQFIEGLYEIQRGYNISATGIDDEQKDSPICTAGTFNKLMEKLSGIHPDVELLFITKNTAALKFPVIVREEVKNYLKKLSKPETREGFHYFIKLLEQLVVEGIEIIWNKIKPQVADRLFDEFKSIYQDNRENLDFLGLVDSGLHVELKDDLSAYQQQIVSSVGYREYCSQTLQNFKFFSLEKRDDLSNHYYNNPKSPKIGSKI